MDFSWLSANLPALLSGAWVTLYVSAIAIAVGMVGGLLLALLRTRGGRLAAAVVAVYVEVIRNVPFLVILYLVYFGLPLLGLRWGAVATGIIALCFSSVGYTSEIFRGGLKSIGVGQYLAADAIGLSTRHKYLHVILPQLFRVTYPALGNQVVTVILGSALTSVIAVPDIMYEAGAIGSSTFAYTEVYIVSAIVYVAVVFLVNSAWSAIGVRINRRRPARVQPSTPEVLEVRA